VADCRRVLGAECTLDDLAVTRLRDELYALADVVLSSFAGGRQERLDSLAGPDRDDIEERAAILEFDGGVRRQAAERIALARHPRHRRQ
jgi:hypothetical protein